MSINVDSREEQNVIVIEVSGRITLGEESNTLRDRVKQVIGTGSKELVLSIPNVDFVDSSGLGVLVGLNYSASASGAKLKLAGASPRFSSIMKMTRLDGIIESHPTLAEAIASFQNKTATAGV